MVKYHRVCQFMNILDFWSSWLWWLRRHWILISPLFGRNVASCLHHQTLSAASNLHEMVLMAWYGWIFHQCLWYRLTCHMSHMSLVSTLFTPKNMTGTCPKHVLKPQECFIHVPGNIEEPSIQVLKTCSSPKCRLFDFPIKFVDDFSPKSRKSHLGPWDWGFLGFLVRDRIINLYIPIIVIFQLL